MSRFFRRKPTPPLLDASLPPVTSVTLGNTTNPISWAEFQAQYLNFPGTQSHPIPNLETTWSNEKIVAYRTVKVVEDDGMWLGHYHPDGPSLTTERHGDGETMTAKCKDSCDPSPSMSCPSTEGDGCGWYAYKTKDQAEAAIRRDRKGWGAYRVARVLLWGTVIEYTEGYRAQYLAVDEIYETPAPEPVREVPRSGPGTMIMLGTRMTTADPYANLMNTPAMTAKPCGEPCIACHKMCARDGDGHVDHYCSIGIGAAERKGFKLL